MISKKDLFEEIREMEKICDKDLKNENPKLWAQLKAQILTLKLLHNLRANSVKIMEKFGISTSTVRRNGGTKEAGEETEE